MKPTPRVFYPIATELKDLAGAERINIAFLDYGGTKIRTDLCEALQTYRVRYRQFELRQGNRRVDGYRSIDGLSRRVGRYESAPLSPEAMEIPNSPILLIADNNIETGASMVGAIVYCLRHRDAMGEFEKLLTVVVTDHKGYVSDFATQRGDDDLMDLDTLFRRTSPDTYGGLEEADLLKYVAQLQQPKSTISPAAEGAVKTMVAKKRRRPPSARILRRLTV